MDGLLDEFDDLDLRDPASHIEADAEGTRPAPNGEWDSDDDEDDVEDAVPCETQEEIAGAREHVASPRKGSESGDLTCAICLGDIALENMAMVKGCDHIYCAKCILYWALHKESPWCPQCKQSFSYLLTYRTLDGTLSDFPVEESVVLLKRARWFEESIQHCHRSLSLLEDSRLADDVAWHDYDADDYDLAEDEEIEAFYFSSAAGRARVLLGNRRFGEGGYITGGRRQARPVRTPSSSSSGKGKGKAALNSQRGEGPSSSTSAATSAAIRTPNAHGGRKSIPSPSHVTGDLFGPYAGSGSRGVSPVGSFGNEAFYGSSPSGSGRRARRNARRAAADCMAALGSAELREARFSETSTVPTAALD